MTTREKIEEIVRKDYYITIIPWKFSDRHNSSGKTPCSIKIENRGDATLYGCGKTLDLAIDIVYEEAKKKGWL